MKRMFAVAFALALGVAFVSPAAAVTQLKSERITTSDTKIQELEGDQFVAGFHGVTTSGEGSIVLQNNNNSGDTLVHLTTGGDSESIDVEWPGFIEFPDGVWVEFTNVKDLTLILLKQN